MSHALSVCHGAFGRAALYRLDKTIITHAHREGHLIFYIGGEEARVLVDGRPQACDGSHVIAISPWEPHSFEPVTDGECLCLVMYIKPMWFLENSVSAEYALNFGNASVRITPRIADCVKRLTGLLLDDESRDLFDAMLFEITRICFEQSWKNELIQGPLHRARCRFSDFRVRRSLRFMQEHTTYDVEMEGLARQVGLSRAHFFKLFKRQMGVTPNIYLNTLRSEQAIDDLLTTPKTVTDIAYDLGFSSQASFTRFFSSNVGISPSEYRRIAHVS